MKKKNNNIQIKDSIQIAPDNSATSQSILHDFYVDDLLKEANTARKKLEEAITIREEIDALV